MLKQSEIGLKEKINQFTRENNLLTRKVEEEVIKNKNILDEFNLSNKKLSDNNYDLNLYKNNLNIMQLDNKNLLKQ